MDNNISWLKIASGTAKPRFSPDTIQQWFIEADRSNRLQVPDIDTCEKVAMRLEQLLSLSAPPLSPVSIETKKYARLLLCHLARDYAAIKALDATKQSMIGWDALTARVREAVAPFAGAGGIRHTRRQLPRRGDARMRSVAAIRKRAQSRCTGQPDHPFCRLGARP
jgi:hypothetical protein